jgi:hypothetical protein
LKWQIDDRLELLRNFIAKILSIMLPIFRKGKFDYIAKANHFDADIEELIAERDW